VPLASEAAS